MVEQNNKNKNQVRNSNRGRNSKRRKTSRRDNNRNVSAVPNAQEIALSKSNPYTWYANFPNYAKDVATIAFGTPLGQPMYFNSTDPITGAGVCALWYIPGVGISSDNASPINRQATRFQTYLRSIQRSAAGYDAADSMMYMIAIDSLYTFWAFMRRAYGVAQLFTPTNKYYPKRLLQAMDVDPNIANNLADFRAFINRFALNIGRFALPAKFDIAERHMWMTTGMYVDSNTTRAQTYMFVPELVWKYDNTVPTGSKLTPVYIKSNTMLTLDKLIEIANELLTAIENDDDTMNISGDIYRAYGPDGLMRVEETPDSYAIAPVYDEVVLSQIENCTIVGNIDKETLVINQDPSINSGAIIFTPKYHPFTVPLSGASRYGMNVAAGTKNPCINMHMDSPSPENVMEATRLMALGTGVPYQVNGNNTDTYYITVFGTELVTQCDIIAFNPDNPVAVRKLEIKTQSVYVNAETHVIAGSAHLEVLALLHQFDWAPMMYIVTYHDTGSDINVLQIDADIDNFTMIKAAQLTNIHEAALLSLLDVGTPARV